MKKYTITVNGTAYEVFVEEEGAVASAPAAAPAPATAPAPAAAPAAPKAAPAAAGANTVNAPMPGTILKMNVKVGDTVPAGGLVCILEAMKMENEIFSEKGGKVVAINAPVGTAVQSGDAIVTLG
ncbi:MAG: acetyl-CoA carboxylase biotin carboxyl carrier protein subunit [Ruminococcaceae bacterium]|nr:acetyl-CoA carboxylase biotin carboxyl carrier protein subunit [Oscillospiraceae bacterium]